MLYAQFRKITLKSVNVNLLGEGEDLTEGKTEYIFEILREDDINECVEIITKYMRNRLGQGEIQFNKETFKQRLKDPNFMTLVGKYGEKIKGVINVLIPPNFFQPPQIVFVGVADQENAVKGLPGMLIDEFIDELKRRFPKASLIEVDLASKDTNAVAMYSSKGFSVEGFTKEGVGGADIVVLRKRFGQDTPRTPIA